jgi:cytosine/adenosine deaminase-related metal-dependent hydrolase
MNPARQAARNSLLIRDIHTLVTMDDKGTRHSGGYIYIEDGAIRKIGKTVPAGLRAQRIVRANTCVAIPGLVNTHHHLFQTLTRACRDTADAELFEWLTKNYPKWAHIDEEAVHVAALVGMAELMLSGCTTTTDHHYLFPKGETKLIDAQIAAARKIGIRFHPTRGSMDVGKSKGGLPPDSVVQSEDEILADCERVVRKFHDASPGSMLRVALAPCSPFTSSTSLMIQTAELAEKLDVRLHTHMAETKDEEVYCLKRFKKRPLEFMEDLGWMSERTWVAHGIHFTGAEVRRLGRARVGVAHCPTSNMRLASGICPALALQKAGSPVGLGVDGSASNDSSHLLAEARQALLLNRLAHGAAAIRVDEALHMATVGGAKCLGRENDIGTLGVGKRADIALFDLRDAGYSGAEDPMAALLLCAPQRAHTLVVNGRVVVENGRLTTVSLEPIVTRHRKIASNITGQPALL